MPRRTIPKTVEQLAELSLAKGVIPTDELDRVLLEDRGFESRVDALVDALGIIPMESSASLGDKPLPRVERERVRFGTKDDDVLRPYLRDVGRIPKMERDDEVRLSKRLEFARRRFERFVIHARLEETQLRSLLHETYCDSFVEQLKSRGRRTSGLPEMSPPDRLQALRARCSELNAIRAEFVERNLHIVVNVSMNYRTYGVPVVDLVQEGNAALIRAVEKFDWRKNVRFQTYSTFWIRQAVERAIAFNKGIVRVPNYLQQKMRRLRREGVIPRGRNDVSVKEMSEAFEVKPEVAGHLLETEKSHYSLDASVDQDGESFASFLAEEEAPPTLDSLEFPLLRERLEEVLECLTPQERRILELRYGLRGQAPLTLEKVGKRMKVSRERIRQLQVRAIRKLQKPGLLEKLEGFV